MLIGLPVEPPADPAPVPRLGEIRRRCEARGFRHKYHAPDGPLDPDAYLVLGELTGSEPPRSPLRPTGVLTRPTFVRLDRTDLTFVEFDDPTLPRATSRWHPL